MTTVTENWQANLIILGKLERGDMLAVAGDDGKLVRKTNWLTQATNNSKTRGEDLFNDIKDVLDTAVKEIDDNPDHDPELIQQYVKAHKGLEILLSTYKSKGSKETELIGKLSLVLAQHMVTMESNNANVVLKPQELKKYAEQAIQFLNDCRIRSVNNVLKGGWGNSYFDEEQDQMIFGLMVRFASNHEIEINHSVKNLKSIMATIIKMPCSRREKKVILLRELQNFIDRGEAKNLKNLQDVFATKKYHLEKQPEACRIKYAKNAIRHRLGNCMEKSYVVATHLAENTKGDIGISIIGGKLYDHVFVLISKEKEKLEAACKKKIEIPANGNYKHLFPHDTWVVDGWTRDWWQLRAWTNSMGNLRQLGVRMSIRKAIESGEFNLREIVTWPPKYPYISFRLRFAHMGSLNLNMREVDNISLGDWQKAVQVLQTMKYELNFWGWPIT